jgi:hypothetical protein
MAYADVQKKRVGPLNYGGLSEAGNEVLGSFLFVLPSKPEGMDLQDKKSSVPFCFSSRAKSSESLSDIQ